MTEAQKADARALVSELRRTRQVQASYKDVTTKDGGRRAVSCSGEVPVHGAIAIRAADLIESLL